MSIRTLLKVSLMLIAVIAVCLAIQSPAMAQGCAMCKASVANSATAKAQIKAFNNGVLALLIPPVTMMGVILSLAYKRRGAGEVEPEAQENDRDWNLE